MEEPKPEAVDVELAPQEAVADRPPLVGRASCHGAPCSARLEPARRPELADPEPLVAPRRAPAALVELGQRAHAEAAAKAEAGAETAAQVSVGPFSYLCKPKGLCGCALLLGALGYLYVKLLDCCGENSCFTRCACWKLLRLKAGLDEFAHLDLNFTVHRCRDLPSTNDQLFVAVFPRRSGGSQKPPKLDKGTKTVRTSKSADHIWEQELALRVEQGVTKLQVVLFKTARIGKGTVLGWDHVKIHDLLHDGKSNTNKIPGEPPAPQKMWLTLHGEDGQRIGSLQVTVKTTKGLKSAKGSVSGGATSSEEQSSDVPVPRPLGGPTGDFTADIDACAQALSGPLHQADKAGDYQLRWFRLEMKRGVAAWAWYPSRDPAPGTKPIGRIPVLSITLVHPVPKSASEFVLRYSNANRRMVDMMLQRHDRPRDAWIGALHRCIEVVRAERQALTNKRKEDEETSGQESQPRAGTAPAAAAAKGLEPPRTTA